MITEDKLWTVQLSMIANTCGWNSHVQIIVHHVCRDKLVVEIRNKRNMKVAFGNIDTTNWGGMADTIHNQMRMIYSKTK